MADEVHRIVSNANIDNPAVKEAVEAFADGVANYMTYGSRIPYQDSEANNLYQRTRGEMMSALRDAIMTTDMDDYYNAVAGINVPASMTKLREAVDRYERQQKEEKERRARILKEAEARGITGVQQMGKAMMGKMQGKSHWLMYTIIAIIVIVIIIVVAVVVIKKKGAATTTKSGFYGGGGPYGSGCPCAANAASDTPYMPVSNAMMNRMYPPGYWVSR